MPFCASGHTELQTDAPTFVTLSPSELAKWMPASLDWLKPFIAALPPLPVLDAYALCFADPVGDPSFDSDDLLAIVSSPFLGTGTTVYNKVLQLLKNRAWPYYCQCSSGTTPSLPPAQTLPDGSPTFTPPAYSGGGACAASAPVTMTGENPGSDPGITLVSGATSVRTIINWDPDLTVPSDLEATVIFRLGFSTIVHSYLHTLVGSGGDFTYTDDVPAGADNVTAWLRSFPPGYEGTTTIVQEQYGNCTGSPGGSMVCCPPDANMVGTLSAILTAVTLIQRQLVPFGYIASTAHSGLTLSGELDVQGLLGIRVDLTTIPGHLGSAAGDPAVIFDAGWIAWGNDDGFETPQRISRSPMVSFPAAAGQFTRIGFTLLGGSHATITELIREP